MAKFPVKDGQTFLFIGDSITDCGRRGPAAPFGDGYVSLFIDLVTSNHPDRGIRFINKGIGGDTVAGLRNRWQDDVIRHQPDWLSVKIGINDLHQTLGGGSGLSPKEYREDYSYILDAALAAGAPKLILIDPFYISLDTTGQSFRSRVLDLLPEYIKVVDDLAKKHKAVHVRTHAMYQKQLRHREPDHFCPEPVHPNRTGHLMIAQEVYRSLAAV